ncbi:hypothetical protein GCM10009853_047580 [Glycomyces scopariae]|uniref:Uncharacterized protein n=1 Tax=Glycomyces sambucus TaxID=380244 RepID=A0A1G9D762_9ACTN|nr:hypothetical protein [Glycomyces sambucus]SDK59701.1 hypothetical protein SAMN05216298_0715 [Glycomyces sambucus]
MASAVLPDEGPYNLRSDGKPGIDGYIGDFCRGPAAFTLYTLGAHPADPAKVTEYLLDVDDGAGPRECCRFFDDAEAIPEWARTWQGDPWCPGILERCRHLIAEHAEGGEGTPRRSNF